MFVGDLNPRTSRAVNVAELGELQSQNRRYILNIEQNLAKNLTRQNLDLTRNFLLRRCGCVMSAPKDNLTCTRPSLRGLSTIERALGLETRRCGHKKHEFD